MAVFEGILDGILVQVARGEFCAQCKFSSWDGDRNDPCPWFCIVDNEHHKSDDFCSRGKEG